MDADYDIEEVILTGKSAAKEVDLLDQGMNKYILLFN